MCHKGEAKKRRLLTVRVLQQKGTGSPYSSSDAIFFFFHLQSANDCESALHIDLGLQSNFSESMN